MKFFFYIFIYFCSLSCLFPQSREKAVLIPSQQELILQLAPQTEAEAFVKNWNLSGGKTKAYSFLTHKKTLSARLNIHLLEYRLHGVDKEVLVDQLQNTRGVLQVQHNHPVQFRTIPNDRWIGRQWPVQRIGLDKVWDLSTGGITASGDTIVVAILDQGFDIEHQDLKGNIWKNRADTPFDGFDNDGNGYPDDEAGWNFVDDSPDFTPNSHGSSVAGLIGAQGNNSIGVAGVNWTIKLMLFQISDVAHVISAYEYVAEQRRLYNSTGGRRGAFVVATNASFGADFIFCSEEPIWGEMYNELGKVGVLTGAAASNKGSNIDISGDIPSTCTSPYLVSVLNTNEADRKEPNSSYSTTHVDLASPGEDSYTTKPFDRYGLFGDNSAAAPHLTGAIALLYAIACEEIIEASKSEPAQTALFFKDLLLNGVDILPELEEYTLTGGRLNVWRSAGLLEQTCSKETESELAWENLYPNPAGEVIYLDFLLSSQTDFRVEIYNALGQLVWQNKGTSSLAGIAQREVVEVGDWVKGVYVVKIKAGNDYLSESFVKR